jgi:hypothetical protein
MAAADVTAAMSVAAVRDDACRTRLAAAAANPGPPPRAELAAACELVGRLNLQAPQIFTPATSSIPNTSLAPYILKLKSLILYMTTQVKVVTFVKIVNRKNRKS